MWKLVCSQWNWLKRYMKKQCKWHKNLYICCWYQELLFLSSSGFRGSFLVGKSVQRVSHIIPSLSHMAREPFYTFGENSLWWRCCGNGEFTVCKCWSLGYSPGEVMACCIQVFLLVKGKAFLPCRLLLV